MPDPKMFKEAPWKVIVGSYAFRVRDGSRPALKLRFLFQGGFIAGGRVRLSVYDYKLYLGGDVTKRSEPYLLGPEWFFKVRDRLPLETLNTPMTPDDGILFRKDLIIRPIPKGNGEWYVENVLPSGEADAGENADAPWALHLGVKRIRTKQTDGVTKTSFNYEPIGRAGFSPKLRKERWELPRQLLVRVVSLEDKVKPPLGETDEQREQRGRKEPIVVGRVMYSNLLPYVGPGRRFIQVEAVPREAPGAPGGGGGLGPVETRVSARLAPPDLTGYYEALGDPADPDRYFPDMVLQLAQAGEACVGWFNAVPYAPARQERKKSLEKLRPDGDGVLVVKGARKVGDAEVLTFDYWKEQPGLRDPADLLLAQDSSRVPPAGEGTLWVSRPSPREDFRVSIKFDGRSTIDYRRTREEARLPFSVVESLRRDPKAKDTHALVYAEEVEHAPRMAWDDVDRALSRHSEKMVAAIDELLDDHVEAAYEVADSHLQRIVDGWASTHKRLVATRIRGYAAKNEIERRGRKQTCLGWLREIITEAMAEKGTDPEKAYAELLDPHGAHGRGFREAGILPAGGLFQYEFKFTTQGIQGNVGPVGLGGGWAGLTVTQRKARKIDADGKASDFAYVKEANYHTLFVSVGAGFALKFAARIAGGAGGSAEGEGSPGDPVDGVCRTPLDLDVEELAGASIHIAALVVGEVDLAVIKQKGLGSSYCEIHIERSGKPDAVLSFVVDQPWKPEDWERATSFKLAKPELGVGLSVFNISRTWGWLVHPVGGHGHRRVEKQPAKVAPEKDVSVDVRGAVRLGFDWHSSVIAPEQRLRLERQLANYRRLFELPFGSLEVVGYSSPDGPAALNQKLSEHRAQALDGAIAEALGRSGDGIIHTRKNLTVQGFGEETATAPRDQGGGGLKNPATTAEDKKRRNDPEFKAWRRAEVVVNSKVVLRVTGEAHPAATP